MCLNIWFLLSEPARPHLNVSDALLSRRHNPIKGQAENPPFPANMSKRNAFRGPGFWNLDGALYKNIRVTEGKQIQLRFEVYNVFNHANAFISGGETEVNTGFVPAFFNGRRNVQLAGKFIF